MAVEPLDGEDQSIFSKKVPVSPYSFVDETQDYSEEAPPPTYISPDELEEVQGTDMKTIFTDLEFCDRGGLRCVNEEAMER